MSLSRIAKRYAKPLLELAEERKMLEEVKHDMEMFDGICADNKDFVNMLKSPIIAHLKKAEILDAIFRGKVNELTLLIFSTITKKNREGILPNVAQEFLRLYNDKKGFQEATVTTTFSLDAEMRKQVESLVSELSGKKPMLKEFVDPEIVGGFVLKLGDRQVDESLSGKLQDLRLKFKKESKI